METGNTAVTHTRRPRFVVLPATCWRRLMSRADDYPQGPNGMAQACENIIAELEAKRLTVPRSERRLLNERLHSLRELLAWCKTRAGYEEPAAYAEALADA
ncbi:MAG: hypothetical protein ABIU18_08260 [Novosphingobium sp.]